MFWRKIGKSNHDLFVIVGLGNPGKEYTASRHNAGFLAIDRLMDRYGITEGEAHRRLQRYAMNHGMKMEACAAKVLREAEGASE